MWRYHICAATVFSFNELAHEYKKSTSDWRTSLKNAFAQDSVRCEPTQPEFPVWIFDNFR